MRKATRISLEVSRPSGNMGSCGAGFSCMWLFMLSCVLHTVECAAADWRWLGAQTTKEMAGPFQNCKVKVSTTRRGAWHRTHLASTQMTCDGRHSMYDIYQAYACCACAGLGLPVTTASQIKWMMDLAPSVPTAYFTNQTTKTPQYYILTRRTGMVTKITRSTKAGFLCWPKRNTRFVMPDNLTARLLGPWPQAGSRQTCKDSSGNQCGGLKRVSNRDAQSCCLCAGGRLPVLLFAVLLVYVL